MSTRWPAIARMIERRLQHAPSGTPRVIAVTGPVAVGKTAAARVLRRTLIRRMREPVEIVSTDGFLRSDAELRSAGLFERKGFPESYSHEALASFFAALREPSREILVPVYCHRACGIVAQRRLERPRWLILEGVYAHQPARASGLPCFTIFLDAAPASVEGWYLERFARLHGHKFSSLAEGLVRARHVFQSVNLLNYTSFIAPLRKSADLALHKAATHRTVETYAALPPV